MATPTTLHNDPQQYCDTANPVAVIAKPPQRHFRALHRASRTSLPQEEMSRGQAI